MQTEITLSPSSLNLMIECPRCFWEQMKEGIKRPSSPFPSLPNGMDKILKVYFDRYRFKGELPPELKIEADLEDFKLLKDQKTLDEWRNCFKGIKYKDKDSGITLKGAVDELLVDKNGKVAVLDFKTRGYPPKPDSVDYYKLQLNLYVYLLKENGLDTLDFGFLLFYYPDELRQRTKFKFKYDLAEVKVSPKEGERAFRKAINILEGDKPNLSSDCEFCRWRNT